jgi:hypothetical protein
MREPGKTGGLGFHGILLKLHGKLLYDKRDFFSANLVSLSTAFITPERRTNPPV